MYHPREALREERENRPLREDRENRQRSTSSTDLGFRVGKQDPEEEFPVSYEEQEGEEHEKEV